MRGASEFAEAHIAGSLHIPYGELARRLDELPRDRPLATICKGGKRSGLAASVLQREGFETIHVAPAGSAPGRSEGRPVETAEARPKSPPDRSRHPPTCLDGHARNTHAMASQHSARRSGLSSRGGGGR